MLITIYNNEAKDSFQTNFKSNMILPKNCEIKLTNAFIALAHRITIPIKELLKYRLMMKVVELHMM